MRESTELSPPRGIMATFSYLPAREAGWLAVADGPRMLLLSPSGWALHEDGRRVIRSAGGFEAAVDLLTRSGIGSIPDFVLLEHTGASVRSLLRGPVTLAVTDGSGQQSHDGTGISTWAERTFRDVHSAEITVTGAESVAGTALLPLHVGSALVSTLRIAATATSDPIESGASVTPSEGITATASEATVSSPLDGHTVVRHTTAHPVASASAVPPPSAGPGHAPQQEVPPSPSATERPGDHDGNTIRSSDLPRSRTRSSRDSAAHPPVPAALPLVLRLSTGGSEPLDAPVIVGRAPTVSQVSGERMPRLVTVGDSDQDISRNHARVSVEGETVVVTDLHSRNGTLVVLPGRSPQKLRAGEPTAVIVGTVVDLGGGITFTVGEG